jgi:hypothetical protein
MFWRNAGLGRLLGTPHGDIENHEADRRWQRIDY